MATLVIVQQICDVCGDGATVAGVSNVTPLRVIVGKVEYEVDLCEECYGKAELLKVMRPVKRAYAKKVKATDNDPAGHPDPDNLACGWKGCDYVAPRLQSLGAHRTKRGHR